MKKFERRQVGEIKESIDDGKSEFALTRISVVETVPKFLGSDLFKTRKSKTVLKRVKRRAVEGYIEQQYSFVRLTKNSIDSTSEFDRELKILELLEELAKKIK